MTTRGFFPARDNDGHWYLIPEANREEWDRFLNIPEDDQRSWDVPDFAESLGGFPGLNPVSDDPLEGAS